MFICPVCKEALAKNEKVFRCSNGHSFDIAKQGYVNLLMSQQSASKRHGDDRVMVDARKNFLEKNYYMPLAEKLCQMAEKYSGDKTNLLDAGCGEGWYGHKIIAHLESCGIKPSMAGIDISKDALKYAGKRCGDKIDFAVGSVYNMPVGNETQDIVFNIFAPLAENEYSRILKKTGVLIRVVPMERHLFGLKEKIYNKPYLNDEINPDLPGFILLEEDRVCYKLKITENEDIENLFKMTPYYYKTGREDQKKALVLTELETEIEFEILIYRKA